MVELDVLIGSQNIRPYLGLTFPEYRKYINNLTNESSVIAVLCFEDTRIIGLTLVEMKQADKSAKILSIFVKKSHRLKGYASKMMQFLENYLIMKDIGFLEITYTTTVEEVSPMDKLLGKMNWSPPFLRMALFEFECSSLLNAEWVERFATLDSEFEICGWHSVLSDEFEKLATENWIPSELHPKRHLPLGLDNRKSIPNLCLAVRHKGNLVGWHITHELSNLTARFSVTYVKPSLQQNLILLMLWYHAAIQANTIGYNKIKMGVSVRHRQMMAFCETFLTELASKKQNSKGCSKLLRVKKEAIWV